MYVKPTLSTPCLDVEQSGCNCGTPFSLGKLGSLNATCGAVWMAVGDLLNP